MPHPKSIYERIMDQNNPSEEYSKNTSNLEITPALGKKKTHGLIISLVSTVFIVASASVVFWIIDGSGEKIASSNNITLTESNINLPQLVFLDQARDAKLISCGAMFPALGSLLVGGTSYEVQTNMHKQHPDIYSVQSLVGMNFASEEYSGPAAGVVFASPSLDSCEGTMIRVVPFEKSCVEIEGTLPDGSVSKPPLSDISIYQLAENNAEVMLLPAQNSCIAITIMRAANIEMK